jgi:DNA polymerase (family X)
MGTVNNAAVAEQFEELGDRLLLQGESWFKVSAYRRAAETLRALIEPIERVAARNALGSLPGVGAAIKDKINAYLETGHITLLDRLRSEQMPGLLALMRETGLTPRNVRTLAVSPLKIDSVESLRAAVIAGNLDGSGAIDAAGLQAVRKWAQRSPSGRGLSARPPG